MLVKVIVTLVMVVVTVAVVTVIVMAVVMVVMTLTVVIVTVTAAVMVVMRVQSFSVFNAFLYCCLSLLALLSILCTVVLLKQKFNSTESPSIENLPKGSNTT